MRDRALGLLEAGLSVIPLQVGDKRPVVPWVPYQYRHATTGELDRWFSTPCNLGIVTGAVSGIVAIDCDSPEALAWAAANLPATPMRTRTARGEHWFYRHPGPMVPNRAHVGELALDVRGDGGYVVGPGSLHPSGATYTAIGTWPPVETLPVFDQAWIVSVARPAASLAPERIARRVSGRNEITWL